MHDILAKPWAGHETGTVLADNAQEAVELGAVEVAPVRFAYLRDHGFFKAAARREQKGPPAVESGVDLAAGSVPPADAEPTAAGKEE